MLYGLMLTRFATQCLLHLSLFSPVYSVMSCCSLSFAVIVKRKADIHLEEAGETMPAGICILKVIIENILQIILWFFV